MAITKITIDGTDYELMAIPNEPKQLDYEIQCLVKDGKNYWIQKDGLYKSDLFGAHLPAHWFSANGAEIHSVKRLSDNEVFTIGDKINHRESSDYDWSIYDAKIIKFNICQNSMLVEFMPNKETNKTGSVVREISDIEKIKERKPLFTTEDKVEVFEDTRGHGGCLLSTRNWLISNISVLPKVPFYGHEQEFKYFSNKEAANEYVLMNKPCLSVNDINNYFEGWAHKPNDYVLNLIKELAKQKIK